MEFSGDEEGELDSMFPQMIPVLDLDFFERIESIVSPSKKHAETEQTEPSILVNDTEEKNTSRVGTLLGPVSSGRGQIQKDSKSKSNPRKSEFRQHRVETIKRETKKHALATAETETEDQRKTEVNTELPNIHQKELHIETGRQTSHRQIASGAAFEGAVLVSPATDNKGQPIQQGGDKVEKSEENGGNSEANQSKNRPPTDGELNRAEPATHVIPLGTCIESVKDDETSDRIVLQRREQELQATIQQAKQTIRSLNSKLEAAQASSTIMGLEIQEYAKAKLDMSRQMSMLASKMTSTTQEKEAVESHSHGLEQRNNELKNQSKRQAEQLQSLQAKLSKREETSILLEEQLRKKIDASYALRTEIASLSKAMVEIQNTNKLYSDRVECLEKELSKKGEKLHEMERVVVQYKTREEELSVMLKETEKQKSETERIVRKQEQLVGDLKGQLAEKQTINAELEEKLERMTREEQVSSEQVTTLTNKLEESEKSNHSTAEKMNLVERAKEQLEAEATAQKSKIDRLQAKLFEANTTSARFESLLQEGTHEMERVAVQYKTREEELSGMSKETEKQKSEMEKIVRNQEQLIGDLKSQLAEKQTINAELDEKLERLTREKQISSEQVTTLTNMLEESKKSNHSTAEKMDFLERAKVQLEVEATAQKSKIDKLEAKLSEANTTSARFESLLQEKTNAEETLKHSVTSLTNKLGEMSKVADTYESRARSSEETKVELEEKVKDYDQQVKTLQEEMKNSTDALVVLQDCMKTKDETETALKTQLASLVQKFRDLGSVTECYASRIESLERKLTRSRDREAKLNHSIEEYQSREMALQESISTLQHQSAVLEADSKKREEMNPDFTLHDGGTISATVLKRAKNHQETAQLDKNLATEGAIVDSIVAAVSRRNESILDEDSHDSSESQGRTGAGPLERKNEVRSTNEQKKHLTRLEMEVSRSEDEKQEEHRHNRRDQDDQDTVVKVSSSAEGCEAYLTVGGGGDNEPYPTLDDTDVSDDSIDIPPAIHISSSCSSSGSVWSGNSPCKQDASVNSMEERGRSGATRMANVLDRNISSGQEVEVELGGFCCCRSS